MLNLNRPRRLNWLIPARILTQLTSSFSKMVVLIHGFGSRLVARIVVLLLALSLLSAAMPHFANASAFGSCLGFRSTVNLGSLNSEVRGKQSPASVGVASHLGEKSDTSAPTPFHNSDICCDSLCASAFLPSDRIAVIVRGIARLKSTYFNDSLRSSDGRGLDRPPKATQRS